MPLKTIFFAVLARALSLQDAPEKLPPLPGDDAELEISVFFITSTALEGLALTDKGIVDLDPRGECNATWDFTLGSRTNTFKNSPKIFPYLIQEGMTPADANSTKSTTTRPQAPVPVGQK